ncbi:hypothetical protein, partial [Pseudomonas syringae pv. coryli]|uniref:hypothetical protein n=1 Tax=Pseudomonas syringae pv. coryli TaxID=317659 RepID=UPI001C3F3DC0
SAAPYLLPLRPTERLEATEKAALCRFFRFLSFTESISSNGFKYLFKYTAGTGFYHVSPINFRIGSSTVGLCPPPKPGPSAPK